MRHYVRRTLSSVATLIAAAIVFMPSAGHAQSACKTELHDQSSGMFSNGDTVCQGAVNGKCSFSLALCVNQGTGCTPQDLKKKKIKAKGNCSKKLTVKANGTTATCGASGTIKVKTKKKKTQAGTCTVKVKAGTDISTVTLDCEPQASSCPSTTTTTIGSTTTTTVPPGDCCSPAPTRLSFTTGVGSGNCGTIKSSAGATTKNLACGGLYTGGGGNTVPLPYAVPDMGTSLTGISSCVNNALTFTNLTSADTGSNRNCTSVGCLFGPPLPIPNSVSTPTSVCVVNSVSTNATGTADCATGNSNLNLPLTSTLYLDGDLFPNAPGIQVCPVCNATCTGGSNNSGPCNSNGDCPGGGTCGGANVCHGGPNNGMACTPDASPVNAGFPTTHDCPPPPLNNIGGLPIAFALTTGTKEVTGVNNTASGQNNVFCGFCRDLNGGGTGCFEGDVNCLCTGSGAPTPCCTGPGTGTCPSTDPKACTSNADCTDGGGMWPDCVQRSPGAFGPAGGGAHTITETGVPSPNLGDRMPHSGATLVSIFCIRPTFNATVDAAGDLPGPGAVALQGTVQVQ